MPFSAPLLAVGILLLVAGLALGIVGTDLLDGNGGEGTAVRPEASSTSAPADGTSTSEGGLSTTTSATPAASTTSAQATSTTTTTVAAGERATSTSSSATASTTTTTAPEESLTPPTTAAPSDSPSTGPSRPSREVLPVADPEIVG